MQEESAWAMGYALGMHALEEAEVIYVSGRMGEQRAHLLAALSMLAEVPERLHHAVLDDLASLRQCPGVVEANHLAVIAEEVLLVIVGVDVADPAGHEQENHPLGFCGVVQDA